MKPSCALICDSGCDISQSLLEKYHIYNMPLMLTYTNGTYLSGIDIEPEEVLRRLETEIPKTSLPSPSIIENVLNKVKEDGYTEAIYVGISSELSSTLNTVRLIASQTEGLDVHVIDSKSISAGAGLITLAAAEMLQEGYSSMVVYDVCERLVEKTYVYFTVRTLEYLHHGGRLSATAYAIGSTLKINPVLTCTRQGTYMIAKKTRGYDRALRAVVSMINSRMKDVPLVQAAIGFDSSSIDYFNGLKVDLKDKNLPLADVALFEISPALVVHCGPGTVGVAAQPHWSTLLNA